MPLHDWTDRPGWDGVHHLWITELLRWIKPQLPAGYRAYIGTAPTVAIGAPTDRPDVGVRQWPEEPGQSQGSESPGNGQPAIEPDEEVAVATIDPGTAVFVESQGKLIAAIELISPRNKDRTVARTTYAARYCGYLLEGVHLLLVDVHRRPQTFSFAERIGDELQMERRSCPAPFAVSYRVGGRAATGGHILAVWRRPLAVGQALPTLPLALTADREVTVDLEQTYQRAAADAYLT